MPQAPSLRSVTIAFTALLAAVLLAGCGPTTSVTGAWEASPPAALPRGHILVVGVTPNARLRRSFELELARLVAARGAQATPAVRVGSPTAPVTAASVADMVKASGADTVLVTRLVGRRVGLEEAPGKVGVKTQVTASGEKSPGLVDFFRTNYEEVPEPGEISSRSRAVIETSVYEARDGGVLAYRITTTTEFDEERDDVVATVSDAIARQLRRAGLLR